MLKKLYFAAKAFYHKTPPCFRWVFQPLKLISGHLKSMRLELWSMQGEEVVSKQPLSIIYAGSEENKNYLVSLAFGNSYAEKYMGKIWLWQFFKMVKERNHDYSLMVVEVPKFLRRLFEKKKWFYIPCWVSGIIDISVSISSLTKSDSLKSDLRRIKKNKLSFELTNELSQLHNFYHNMYLPYIAKAHGDKAIITEYDFVKRRFGNCGLMLIKKEEACVAGVLIAYTKKGVRLWYVGIKDGNLDYIKDGVIGAIYYFPILYLQEKGFKRLGVGESRPFLKDGVLEYKKKWGIEIVGTSKIGFLIKPLLNTAGIKNFFLNNPFIYTDENKLNGAIFTEADQLLSEDDFRKLYKDYYLTGMSGLIIYRFGESGSKIKETVPSEFDDKLMMWSAESLFSV